MAGFVNKGAMSRPELTGNRVEILLYHKRNEHLGIEVVIQSNNNRRCVLAVLRFVTSLFLCRLQMAWTPRTGRSFGRRASYSGLTLASTLSLNCPLRYTADIQLRRVVVAIFAFGKLSCASQRSTIRLLDYFSLMFCLGSGRQSGINLLHSENQELTQRVVVEPVQG